VLWCLVSATTLWTMNAADAPLPFLGALVATAAAIFLRPRSAQARAVMRPHGRQVGRSYEGERGPRQ